MQFRIGTHMYQVKIVRGWIEHDGGEVAGLTNWTADEILISNQVPKERRRNILFHELRHAWLQEYGEPQSAEDDARQAAQWMAQMTDQFTAQGGAAMLAAMKPEPDAASTELRCADPIWNTPAIRDSHDCPLCQSTIPPGAVISDPAAMLPAVGKPAMERGYYCDFCKVVITWTEGATDKGHPNGRLVMGPQILQDARAKEWVRSKGQVAQLHVA